MKFPYFSALGLLAKRLGVTRTEWTVSDLIDFEYYLEGDEQVLREQPAARKVLAQRDRAFHLDHAQNAAASTAAPHTSTHRRTSLRHWLTARRNSEDPRLSPLLPGAAFASAQQLGMLVLAVSGFLIGATVASALLSYDGHRPIDVSSYILLLVLVQFLFAGVAVWMWTLRSLRRSDEVRGNAWLLMQVIRPLLTQAAQWLQRQRLGRASADIRERALATQGLLKSQFTIYGPVAYFPLLIPAQMFGVAFNIGAIMTTIFLELFTDLAFGWGSANFHPETVYDLAQMIALPWSGIFGEGVGYPTLAQITGSQIHLEQWASGALVFHPDSEHLRSWRWFLVLAVVTYGLLPRLILLTLSILMERLALARLTFTHGRSLALYTRMLTPILDTSTTVMTAGAEMPIPAPLLPHTRRLGLVGPLSTKTNEPPTNLRPWREKTPIAPEPIVELKPQPVIDIQPKPIAAPEPAPPVIQFEPEPIIKIEPESIIEQPAQPSFIEEEFNLPPVESKPIVESESLPPVIEPKLKSVVEIEPEPIIEESFQPPFEEESNLSSPVESIIELKPTVELKPPPVIESKPEPIIEIVPMIEPEPEPEPIIEIESKPIEELAIEPVIESESTATSPAIERSTYFAPNACLLLIHVDVDDVLESEDRPRLAQLLLQLTGWQIGASVTFGAGSAMTARALDILERGQWQELPPRLAVIQDGSQPPITENLLFLRELRAAAGVQAQMLLALIGDPEDDDRLPPLRAFDYTDWQRKIDQMADPYLRLEMLAPPSNDGED
ncbi:hypothetical protein CKO09_02245 [Chromatium weissei]|nr:hypothetical protein [Chromatium weissei]